MSVFQKCLPVGVLLVGLAIAAGCEERRYVEPGPAPGTEIAPGIPGAPAGVDVDVNTPAGRVKVDADGTTTAPLVPHRDVKVNVGNGKVEVDVDGKPLVERIRERREERNELAPATP